MGEKDAFKKDKVPKSLRTFITVILMAVVAIPLAVAAVMIVTELRSRATPTENPRNVEI